MSLKPNREQTKISSPAHSMFLNQDMRNKLNASEAGSVIFNEDGKIIAINDEAALLFEDSSEALIDQVLWQQKLLDSFKGKRFLITARRHFVLTKQGIPQQFTWIETCKNTNKPILAYKIVLSQSLIDGNLVYFARIQDFLQFKLIEWVLWSLANLSNKESITAIIDEIAQLIGVTFDVDYVLINLLEHQKFSSSVSIYHRGNNEKPRCYSILNTPCENVIKHKKIYFYPSDVQKDFPKADFLKELNISAYLGGPIINTQKEVVGLLTILSQKPIAMTPVNDILFKLFLDRINLEVDKLLSQKELQLLARIPEEDPNPIIRIKPDGEILYANEEGKLILNYWNEKYNGLPAKIINDIAKAEVSKEILHDEISFQNKTYLLTFVGIDNFNQINIYGTDVTQLKIAEENLLNMARFDALTKTANRQYFEEILIKTLAIHKSENQTLALLLLDLDNFKVINDTLGHHIGDHLLKIACKRMKRCIRDDDLLARLGGDEFIIILNKSDVDDAITVAKKINKIIAEPFQLGEYQLDITASIGIAIYPDSASTASNLLKHSDIAMYQAKKSGKNQYAVFSGKSHEVGHKRQNIIKRELPHAAATGQLFISYQPYINLSNDEISGFESLLRWQHPEVGLILPMEFISLAEQTGTIKTIGQWGIDQALSDFSNKLIKPVSKAELILNISVMQINDARFMDTLLDGLDRYHLKPEQIILDISEQLLLKNITELKEQLKVIDDHGIKLSLNNFGSPQVSLSKLSKLPIHYLKLDQKLLSGIETEEQSRLLLKGIIELAKQLNLIVVQKGVETKEQDKILKSIGCPFGQGNYYCPPVALDQLNKFISNYGK